MIFCWSSIFLNIKTSPAIRALRALFATSTSWSIAKYSARVCRKFSRWKIVCRSSSNFEFKVRISWFSFFSTSFSAVSSDPPVVEVFLTSRCSGTSATSVREKQWKEVKGSVRNRRFRSNSRSYRSNFQKLSSYAKSLVMLKVMQKKKTERNGFSDFEKSEFSRLEFSNSELLISELSWSPLNGFLST